MRSGVFFLACLAVSTGMSLTAKFEPVFDKTSISEPSNYIIPHSNCSANQSDIPRPFYELFPEMGYYKLNTDAKSWRIAKGVCESEGAHLAVINSLREVQILRDLRIRVPRTFNSWKDNLIHIGITEEAKEGEWKTIFNVPLKETGFQEWDSGQPIHGSGEDCGCIYLPGGKLNDCDCDTSILPFLCEREL